MMSTLFVPKSILSVKSTNVVSDLNLSDTTKVPLTKTNLHQNL